MGPFCFVVVFLLFYSLLFFVYLFACCFFNPTMEVVTFRLLERGLLGVFLLLAFNSIGNECHDPLSLCDGMHVCRDETSVYTLSQESWEWCQNLPYLQTLIPPSSYGSLEHLLFLFFCYRCLIIAVYVFVGALKVRGIDAHFLPRK